MLGRACVRERVRVRVCACMCACVHLHRHGVGRGVSFSGWCSFRSITLLWATSSPLFPLHSLTGCIHLHICACASLHVSMLGRHGKAS